MSPRRIRANGRGLTLSVLEWPAHGASRGEVVLVHGFRDAAASWSSVAPALADAGFRVLAPDLRGFGASERAPESAYYYFPDYVFDLACIASDLGLGARFDLVGHSMGGTVAAMYAGAFPERVRRLALLEGLGPPAGDDDGAAARTRAWIDGVTKAAARPERPMRFDDAVARLAMVHGGVPEEVLRERVEGLLRPVEGGFVWAFDPLHRTQSPLPFSLGRFLAHLRRIEAPTLVVSGGPTGFHPADEAARLAALRTATTAELEGAGHMMHWTRPAELARLLVAHLLRGD